MTNYSDLNGKNILITGGTSGIGLKVVETLNELNAEMTILGRNESKILNVKEKLSQIKDYKLCDQTNLDTIESSLSSLTKPFDGVVLSAGIANFLPIKFLKADKTQEIFNVNFFSNIIIIQYLLKKKLLNKNASIVIISSISQYVAETGTSIYSSSKAALSAFARNAALELSPSNIRVNTISPGLVRTELLNDENGLLSKSVMEKNEVNYPLGLGATEDVASAALFLLSNNSKWMTGSDLRMDGGFCLK